MPRRLHHSRLLYTLENHHNRSEGFETTWRRITHSQGGSAMYRKFRHSPEGLATARVRAGRAAYLHIYLDKINGEPRQPDSQGFTSSHKASVWRRCRWAPHPIANGTVPALPRPGSRRQYLSPTLLDTPINRRVKPIAFSGSLGDGVGRDGPARQAGRARGRKGRRDGRGGVEAVFRERTPAPVLFDTPQGHAERFHFIQCVELSILLIAARTPLRAEERGRGCTTLARPLCRGGSPPGSQEALLEATRLTMWKLYNQGLGVGGGFQHEDDGPKLPPPHHPLAGVAFPPQKEALNLEVKDEEVPLFHDNRGYQPFCLQRTGRLKDAVDHRNDLRNDVRNDLRNDLRNELRNDIRNEFRNDVRSRLEEAAIPPSAKRPAQQDDSHDSRLPPPTTPTPPTPPGYPGANIKITSRGGRGQDQSMVVSMEVNGIMYQGVLFAQAPRARFS
ncbi:hypothetical protein E2C01_003143 [Portunus trituberculatus]|uniref:REKLES domain-containing protein n=1 Tax=Portunus trituberculatus TaxID=210409 RepID=A0A5B7CMX7_PORTR|nr:hypothetical protein [Portunus trituberculatus]